MAYPVWCGVSYNISVINSSISSEIPILGGVWNDQCGPTNSEKLPPANIFSNERQRKREDT